MSQKNLKTNKEIKVFTADDFTSEEIAGIELDEKVQRIYAWEIEPRFCEDDIPKRHVALMKNGRHRPTLIFKENLVYTRNKIWRMRIKAFLMNLLSTLNARFMRGYQLVRFLAGRLKEKAFLFLSKVIRLKNVKN